MNQAEQLHKESIVIDGTCPLLFERKHLADYRRGGLSAVVPTINTTRGREYALNDLAAWLRLLSQDDTLVHVRKASDIVAAKKARKMGVIFQFQGADPIEDNVDLIDLFKTLGVGMIQLTYNVKNRIGDGCEERTDAGLSKFGLAVVKRMNEARVIVDVSHTGYRTTMEAIEASQRPVVFSHACARAVYASPRNILDDQIKAVARTGGLVGVTGVPFFVSSSTRPSMNQFLAHVKYMADLVGADHVGLGLDYYINQHPYADHEAASAIYNEHVAKGQWTPATYPPPPYYYPEGMETPDLLPNLTSAMLAQGFSSSDAQKIMGGNWLRVFRDVWGE